MVNLGKITAMALLAEKAATVLEQAGNLDADKDGVKDGDEIRAKLGKVVDDAEALHKDLSELIKLLGLDAKELGIEELLHPQVGSAG